MIAFITALIALLTLYYKVKDLPQKKKETPSEGILDTLNATIKTLHLQLEQTTKLYQTVDRELCTKNQEFIQLKEKFDKKVSGEKSEQVRLGHIGESLIPFLKEFPYNPKDLKALFQPVDYICFSPEEVIFLEVKTGDSQLSEKQRNIRNLINAGKVRWETHRINENGYLVKEGK